MLTPAPAPSPCPRPRPRAGHCQEPLPLSAPRSRSPGATLPTKNLKSIVSSVNRLLFFSIYLPRRSGQIFTIKSETVEHGCCTNIYTSAGHGRLAAVAENHVPLCPRCAWTRSRSRSRPQAGPPLPGCACTAPSSFLRASEANTRRFHRAPPHYVFQAEKQMPTVSFRANEMQTVCCSGSPLKQALCSASAPSPVNIAKLTQDCSLEPRTTQPCGSDGTGGILSLRGKMMLLVPLQNIRDLKVT